MRGSASASTIGADRTGTSYSFRTLNNAHDLTFNDRGHVAGVYTNPVTGNMDGFLLRDGQFTDLAVPGASTTMALGVNNFDEVVGVYTPSGTSALHGFTWTARHGFTTVDDPKGIGTTTINGVNDFGQLVGFYVDGKGNTDGFLATPRH